MGELVEGREGVVLEKEKKGEKELVLYAKRLRMKHRPPQPHLQPFSVRFFRPGRGGCSMPARCNGEK